MKPGSRPCTLVGFAESLDWKPVHFVDALPKGWFCSFCGLVHKKTTKLVCGHVICELCYLLVTETNEYACPIDGQSFPGLYVEWSDSPAERLLRRKVTCWNAEYGCPVTAAASELSKHFTQECSFHCTTCPSCSARVLCKDMCKHIASSCRTRVFEVSERHEDLNGSAETAKSFCKCEAPARKIEETTKLILRGISTLHEELASQRRQSVKQGARVQDAIQAAKQDARKGTEGVLDEVKKVFIQAARYARRCEFFVGEVEKLEATTIIYGSCTYVGGRNYLRGYNIVYGIELENQGSGVSLRMWLELKKGDLDDVIDWPFDHMVRYTIVNPSKGDDHVVTSKPFRSMEEYHQKPTESGNGRILFLESVTLKFLKLGGHLHNDELRVLWELL
ncbi:hypothetical protein HPB50_001289 [Hyalomma asiaticum]|uniref:Uncharacterized protein n=1 Tax=Hyalomma asiaticum TaxID=266040 RepID=A0ACB7RLW0_HYAAI|nr:hypothetical protein HPB50_001289 [Hyalomma asiaticum]